jgi:trehalose 6-phosphate synthase/phosphatase
MGDKTLEIQPSSVDKAAVAKAILRDLMGSSFYDLNSVHEHIDFLLCIGDSKSDESIFSFLNEIENCITSTVGRKKSKTKAKYYIDGADDVQHLLETLVSSQGS